MFLFVHYQKGPGNYHDYSANLLNYVNGIFFLPNSRLAYSSDPKLITTVTEGIKHILQSCLQAGTVETVVITSRDFDNLYGGKLLAKWFFSFIGDFT